jgi:hypothetical protein
MNNPNMKSPNIVSPNIVNPKMTSPKMTNPNMENPKMTSPNMENPMMKKPNMESPLMKNPNSQMSMMEGSSVYPEVFYRVMPHVMMVCDHLDANYGDVSLTQDQMDRVTDSIYDDVREMHPDLEEYMRDHMETDSYVTDVINGDFRSRRRFRRRGPLRDLIDILFLSEFFRRRRRRRFF